ncbi:cuticle protein 70, isoforms A and B [Schistocerca cancellata]|uniref:cuticle protein 70, isoforms A and B n=1 Tax=Schistocerca cancellata TaxID=274614 RepID=UPI002118F304|nr:cuticle protein 70, isoforms A and B [Schistocerca cancellata]
MYKLVILLCAVAAAHAGYLGGYAAPAVAVAPAPALAVAHAPAVPVATSYARIHQVTNSVPVAVAAPAVVKAAVPVAAPVVAAAPVFAAHAPLALGHGYGYGGYHG